MKRYGVSSCDLPQDQIFFLVLVNAVEPYNLNPISNLTKLSMSFSLCEVLKIFNCPLKTFNFQCPESFMGSKDTFISLLPVSKHPFIHYQALNTHLSLPRNTRPTLTLLSYSAFYEQLFVCLLYLTASSACKRANALKGNNKFSLLALLCAALQGIDPKVLALVYLNFLIFVFLV